MTDHSESAAARRVVVPPRADRLPPGQIVSRKWQVLHYSHVPLIDPAQWRFEVTGLVDRPLTLRWEDLDRFPRQETVCDIHCVTRWSRYDNVFTGVPVQAILAEAGVRPEAKFVMVHAAPDYTTNLPLADLDRPENLLATHHGRGAPGAGQRGPLLPPVAPHF